jgi:hypothetical protein
VLRPFIRINVREGVGWSVAPVVTAGAASAAPDGVSFFYEGNFQAAPGGADSRPAACYTPTDNQDIGINFLLLVVADGVRPGWWPAVLLNKVMPFSHLDCLLDIETISPSSVKSGV